MKNALNKIKFIGYSLLLMSPAKLLAQNAGNDYGLRETANAAQLPGAASNRSLAEIVGLIINALMGVLGTLLVLYLIYGGFLWMTAGGEEKQVEKAKEIIKNSIIGLIVIFLAYGIANFVITALVTAAQ